MAMLLAAPSKFRSVNPRATVGRPATGRWGVSILRPACSLRGETPTAAQAVVGVSASSDTSRGADRIGAPRPIRNPTGDRMPVRRWPHQPKPDVARRGLVLTERSPAGRRSVRWPEARGAILRRSFPASTRWAELPPHGAVIGADRARRGPTRKADFLPRILQSGHASTAPEPHDQPATARLIAPSAPRPIAGERAGASLTGRPAFGQRMPRAGRQGTYQGTVGFAGSARSTLGTVARPLRYPYRIGTSGSRSRVGRFGGRMRERPWLFRRDRRHNGRGGRHPRRLTLLNPPFPRRSLRAVCPTGAG